MTPTPPQAGERAEAPRYGMIQVGVMYGEHIVREMEECEGGEWVDYDDYAALVARFDAAVADARRYRWLVGAFNVPDAVNYGIFMSDKELTDTAIDAAIAALDSEESK